MAAPVRYRSNAKPATVTVTEPGVYDIDEDTYHRDPVPDGSLSSTGARKLLPPSCPALFKHEQDSPPGPKKVFDFGHAAHMKVLGVGPEIVVVDFDDWRTAAAQAKRAEAHAAGKTPLLTADAARVDAMAARLREHPMARRLLDPERGRSEQSLFWIDDEFGVWRRARLDHFTTLGQQPVIVDYKTSYDVNPDKLRKSFYDFGYHCQDRWYRDAATAVGLAEDPAFVFVCQMKTPPFLVTVVDFDDDALARAAARNREAVATFHQCRTSGRWPSYADDDIHTLALPAWATRDFEEYLP